MTSPLPNSYTSQFKGYRIRQQTSSQQQLPNQYLLKVIIKNQTNGIPKIRHDVICNGKLYPFIPLISFTSQQDLGIIEQISTIVLKDQNQILCEILSKKVTQIPVANFQDLKKRFQSIFALELKIDPEELFLILISEQINDDSEFNAIFDSITQTEYVSLMKRVYENCPYKLIPKILRRITKYLNSTKGRSQKSIEKFKKILKIIKSTDQLAESQQKIQSRKQIQQSPKKSKQKIASKEASRQNIEQQTKREISQKKVQLKKEQKSNEENVLVQKPVLSITKQEVQAAKKQSQAKRIEKNKQKKAKHHQKKIQLEKQELTPQQNSSDWHDVSNSNDEDQDITDTIGKMAFHADDSDEDTKYQAPKKKSKKKNHQIVQLDPQFDSGAGKKKQRLKKQNKNQSPTPPTNVNDIKEKYRKISNQSEQNAEDKIVEQQIEDKRPKNRQYNKRNGSGNDQSLQKGNRQFTRQKKIDPRILFGINGAPDSVWRERMRPQKYPKNQQGNYIKGKQNKQARIIKATPAQQKLTTQIKQNEVKSSKNLTLQKVFSIPQDSKDGKEFKFQKKNYNLFVNKLFWVNIDGDQVTIQKEGKGYIRKCPVEIIDNGKGIMAEGMTLNIDGLSNLQDGGTVFGDPVFQEFTPQGQWFHISSLDVYAYA